MGESDNEGSQCSGSLAYNSDYERMSDSFDDRILPSGATREKPKQVSGTFASSVFNLVSSCGGGGVLSLPYAFKETGVVVGIVVTSLVALMSAYSAHLLVSCSRRTKVSTPPSPCPRPRSHTTAGQANSYDEIAVAAFRPYGHQAKLFVSGCVFCLCSLGAVGYTILLGDLLTPLAVKAFHAGSIWAQRDVVQLIAICLSYPFCLLKDISSLRYGLSPPHRTAL